MKRMDSRMYLMGMSLFLILSFSMLQKYVIHVNLIRLFNFYLSTSGGPKETDCWAEFGEK